MAKGSKKISVTLLGTGTSQGVPVIACNCEVCTSTDLHDKRLRCSVLLSSEGKNVVIDSGPDFRQQMLREQVQRLDGVVFTHEHKDHVAGTDDVRAFNFKQKEDMRLYADQNVQTALKREFPYAFTEFKYPGVPLLDLIDVDDSPFEVAGIPFVPINVLHYKLPVKCYRIGDFTYITDANFIAPAEKEKIKGSRVLVVNALRKEDHISHFNLEQAIALINELEVEQAYLTHISHLMGRHADVEKELPSHIKIAHDGLRFDIFA